MAIVRGAFLDVFYTRFEDECSPTRHFFANLKLCKHKGKIVKTTMAKDLKKIFHEEYEMKTGTWIIELDDISNSVMSEEQIKQVVDWLRSR